MKNAVMFENYPDVVEVDDLRKMLGGISRKLAYRSWLIKRTVAFESVEPIKSRKSV